MPPCPKQVPVVEDEPAIRQLLRLALSKQGMAVCEAAGGREAVELYCAHWASIGVVLLDVQMPGMDGPATLEALRQVNPAVQVVFMSGLTGGYSAADLLRRGAVLVSDKPFFSFADLANPLKSLAGHPSS